MSIDVMNCVWKHAPVASGEFAVLLALADYADENCTCYPGVETLAAKARLKPRQTQNCVKSLAKTGLITVERGAGPKGCNRYRVEVETIRARSIRQDATQAIKSAINDDDADVESDDDLGEGGANIAPPQSATGGVHSSASGGAMECTQTIIEPSKIPSDERERARANNDLDGENGKTETPVPDENPKAVEREFEKSFRDWPTSISDSRPAALTEWRKLTPDERQMAALEADRYRTACRATGRKVVCAFAVYLREKRWADLPEREPEPLKPVEAPPFGKLWTAERMRRLLAGPEVTDYPLTAFEQKSIDAGTMDRKTVIRGKQVHQGWPTINRMDDLAVSRKGLQLTPERAVSLEQAGMESVKVSEPDEVSEKWEAWKAVFDQRAWPWLPDPGTQPYVWLPAGGPDGLAEFEKAVRGKTDDGGERLSA